VRLAAQARSARRWRIVPGGPPSEQTVREARQGLERLGLTALADTPAGLLSHGDQRLLEVAMALAQPPEVLLLDEPSQGLAPMVVRELARVIRALPAEGVTVLLVEQKLKLAELIADQVFVMVKGRVVYAATPDRLRAEEDDVPRRYLTL
jgi:ABC-type branched-subunit amino acid transport system ATPase component